MNLLKVIEDSFSIYAGMTIQDRAIVDARDGLKPSQRQCMYAQYIDKITYNYYSTDEDLLIFSSFIGGH